MKWRCGADPESAWGATRIVTRFAWLPTHASGKDATGAPLPHGCYVWLERYTERQRWTQVDIGASGWESTERIAHGYV